MSIVSVGLFFVWGCSPQADDTPAPPQPPAPYECQQAPLIQPSVDFFSDVSVASGVQLGNFDPEPVDGTVINDHSRLAFADINGDGYDDIVMHSLYPNPVNGVPFEHLVFINNQDGSFSDHSDASGLRDVQAGLFAFADVDNDGDQDVYAGLDVPDLGAHRSAIMLNDGSGVFTKLDGAGVGVSNPTVATASFADFDNDGAVDLFVGNGHTSYGMADMLFWGHGDGHFTQDSDALQAAAAQPTNGSVVCDYDNDGDMDIFVSSYGVSVNNGHNQLWRNDDGVFKNVARQAGVEALGTGNRFLSSTGFGEDIEPDVDPDNWVGSNAFGVDCGDVDNDGDLDLWVAAISHPNSGTYSRKWSDPSSLLVNQGDGTFEDHTASLGLPFNEGDIDAAMVDFDNDGRLDLSLTRDPKYEASYTDPEQYAWFGLMHQGADGAGFTSRGLLSGINIDIETGTDAGKKRQMKGGQNHAWADIDHDGDLDLLVGGRDQGGGRPNFLYENTLGQDNNWIAVSLVGDGAVVATDAIGARLSYTWATETIVREKHGSRGTYNSEDTRWFHIGLADRDCSAEISVTWPDGTQIDFDWSELGERRFVQIRYPDIIED